MIEGGVHAGKEGGRTGWGERGSCGARDGSGGIVIFGEGLGSR